MRDTQAFYFCNQLTLTKPRFRRTQLAFVPTQQVLTRKSRKTTHRRIWRKECEVPSTLSNSSSFAEWSQFDDEELDFDISPDSNNQRKWQANTLDKSINSYIRFKKFPKLGPRDDLRSVSEILRLKLTLLYCVLVVSKKDLFNIHVAKQHQNNKVLLMVMEISMGNYTNLQSCYKTCLVC